MPNVWRGSTAIHLQPGCPHRARVPEGLKISLVYRGPFTALRAVEPAPPALFAEIDAVLKASLDAGDFTGLYLVSVQNQPDGSGVAGPGTLTLEFQPIDPGATIEIETATLEKPVESNPYYSLITSGIWARFNTWEQEPDPTLKGDLKYTIPGSKPPQVETLNGIIAVLAAKKLRGVTSYVEPAPVVRKTSYSRTLVSTGGVGKVSDPGAGPSGYQWLKTSDRCVWRKSDGRWERSEEWTGAKSWDPDFYPLEI